MSAEQITSNHGDMAQKGIPGPGQVTGTGRWNTGWIARRAGEGMTAHHPDDKSAKPAAPAEDIR
jgi:hypothetical protein